MTMVKCKGCKDDRVPEHDTIEGYCMLCAGQKIRGINALEHRLEKALERVDEQQERIKELVDKLKQHRWIPVTERLPKEGKCLVLCEGKVYEVKVYISMDDWIDNDGKRFLKEIANCNIGHLGSILIGHDVCITHWKSITLPK